MSRLIRILVYLPFFISLYTVHCAAYQGNGSDQQNHINWIGFDPPTVKRKIIQSIQAANSSIYISWYSFADMEIAEELLLASRRVALQISTSYDNEHSQAWQYLKRQGRLRIFAGNQNGLMHNKYMVIDRSIVITGSANFSVDFPKHFNHTVIINSQQIAEQYIDDFIIQSRGYYGSTKDLGVDQLFDNDAASSLFIKKVPLQQTLASAYFTPYRHSHPQYKAENSLTTSECSASCIQSAKKNYCEECPQDACYSTDEQSIIYRYQNHEKQGQEFCQAYRNAYNVILPHLAGAKQRIGVLAFSLREKVFLDRLIRAKRRGISVSLYIDYSQYRAAGNSLQETFQALQDHDISIYITRRFDRGLMHHKLILVDQDLLILGSLNYSQSAVTINDENFIVLENAPHLVAPIEKEIQRIQRQSYRLSEI